MNMTIKCGDMTEPSLQKKLYIILIVTVKTDLYYSVV